MKTTEKTIRKVNTLAGGRQVLITYCSTNEGSWSRKTGPAFISHLGTQMWFVDGMLHRENGPAMIYADGSMEYHLQGMLIKEVDR